MVLPASAPKTDEAPLPPGRPAAATTWPSDSLALWVAAGIVLCFVLHFTQERFQHPAPGTDQLQGANAPGPPGVVRAAARELYDLEICNHTLASRIYVAVAYYDALSADWVARGWYPESRGECRLGLQHLPPPVYVYGETRDGESRWGDAAGVPFCIGVRDGFALPQRRCAQAQGQGQVRLERFRRLPLTGAGGVQTWDVTE